GTQIAAEQELGETREGGRRPPPPVWFFIGPTPRGLPSHFANCPARRRVYPTEMRVLVSFILACSLVLLGASCRTEPPLAYKGWSTELSLAQIRQLAKRETGGEIA